MKYSSALTLLSLATANAFSVLPGSASQSGTALNMFGKATEGGISKTSAWELNQISDVVRVEGQSRHTFNCNDPSRELVQVAMHSKNGRPVDAEIQLWIGPDWTPVTVKAHSEDGLQFPIQTLVGTRNKAANVEVRNTGPASFPIDTAVSYAIPPLSNERELVKDQEAPIYLEGGAVKMAPIAAEIDQLEVLITTEGKMLDACIEFLNGPNNVKAQYDVFTNNGQLNALFVVFETPASGNAIRIRNKAPLEFPLNFYYKASKTGTGDSSSAMWN